MVRDPRPRIAVLGATGAHGGPVARALLAGARHAVRVLTRHPGSPAAQDLELDGAELFAADLDDPDSLRAAFDGARGLFAVTPSPPPGSAGRTLAQARHIADAARDTGVAHVVWSTQEDTRRFVPLEDDHLPTLDGCWKVPSYDALGAANALFRERGVPTTLLHAPFFWDELLRHPMAPRRAADGTLELTLPTGLRPLPGIAAADFGRCAAALFEHPRRWIGRSVGIAGEHATGARMAHALARALGEPVRHVSPAFAELAAEDRRDAAERANRFQFLHDFSDEVCARRPVTLTRDLHPGVLDFEGWLSRHVDRLTVDPVDAVGPAFPGGRGGREPAGRPAAELPDAVRPLAA